MTSPEVYDKPPTKASSDSQVLPGQTSSDPSHASSSSGSAVTFVRSENGGERTQCAGGGTPPLENNAKQIRKTGFTRAEKRRARWLARTALWGLSDLKRVRHCGRYSARPMGTVDVRHSDHDDAGRAGFSGLQSCGSVWACPVCSARIQAERREELHQLVEWAKSKGYTVAFGTVTLRHRKGQPLAELWQAVSKAYTSVHNSAKVKRLRKELGVIGYVRALEVTHGDNGWHPHLHLLWVFENGPETPSIDIPVGLSSGELEEALTAATDRVNAAYQARLDQLADAEFNIWRTQVVKRGLGEPLRKNYQLRMVNEMSVEFTDYFAKGVYDPSRPRAATSMSFEMSGNTTKSGRKPGSRTPWQILEDLATSGDADDLELWSEYELASKGRTSLLWSNGLKALVGVNDKTDEEIADEEVGSEEDILFTVGDWKHARWFGAGILSAVESGGKAAAIEFCVQNGIMWLEPDDPDAEMDRELYASRFGTAED